MQRARVWLACLDKLHMISLCLVAGLYCIWPPLYSCGEIKLYQLLPTLTGIAASLKITFVSSSLFSYRTSIKFM